MTLCQSLCERLIAQGEARIAAVRVPARGWQQISGSCSRYMQGLRVNNADFSLCCRLGNPFLESVGDAFWVAHYQLKSPRPQQ